VNLERVELVRGLDLPAVLARAEAGACVLLTRGGRDVAAIVAPERLGDAALAWLAEAVERAGPSLDALLADLDGPTP
jgi:antitoxin (DNA-binding transcriptional repressor) of toxin-antitoxin stability system